MMVVIIRTKKIIIPIKAFKAMKRVYLILIAIHIGQAPNGPRFSRTRSERSERSGRLEAHVMPPLHLILQVILASYPCSLSEKTNRRRKRFAKF
jgi:hypothetical protein